MKNRRTDISCRIKKAIVSVAINVTTIVQELYAEDRKELIAQISERKRRKYKVALHMVNISKTITHLAMNYLLMKIMWQIVMDPPFGKETYMFSFEACRALFVCFAVIIVDIECTMWRMCEKKPINIDKYLRMLPYLPISGVIYLFIADIGNTDILYHIFLIFLLFSICKSLSKAMEPIVYPYSSISQ
ncbi:MAG: hypothetical protein ACLUOD_09840 [[Clostridium] innocuum]